jgi:hypothetical protein
LAGAENKPFLAGAGAGGAAGLDFFGNKLRDMVDTGFLIGEKASDTLNRAAKHVKTLNILFDYYNNFNKLCVFSNFI